MSITTGTLLPAMTTGLYSSTISPLALSHRLDPASIDCDVFGDGDFVDTARIRLGGGCGGLAHRAAFFKAPPGEIRGGGCAVRRRYAFSTLEGETPPRLKLISDQHDAASPLVSLHAFCAEFEDSLLPKANEIREIMWSIMDGEGGEDSIRRIEAILNELTAEIDGMEGLDPSDRRSMLGQIGWIRHVSIIDEWGSKTPDPADLFARTKEFFKKIKKKVHIDIVRSEHARVKMKESKLERILHNLIENATKGGATNVRLSSSIEGSKYEIVVDDDGNGMDHETASKVASRTFEYLIGKSRHHGLGLLLVRNSVRKAGGEIQLETASGLGTRFTISLPIAK